MKNYALEVRFLCFLFSKLLALTMQTQTSVEHLDWSTNQLTDQKTFLNSSLRMYFFQAQLQYCLQCIVLLEVKLQLKRVGCVCGIRWDPDRLLDSKFVSVGLCNKAPVNCSNAQCVLCKVYFSAQPNKLRPILKFKIYFPIEHIFVPACSSARKIHFF